MSERTRFALAPIPLDDDEDRNDEPPSRRPTPAESRLLRGIDAALKAACDVLQEHDPAGERNCPCPVCEAAAGVLYVLQSAESGISCCLLVPKGLGWRSARNLDAAQ